LTKRKISFINTLNNNGTSIEPCGTPLWMSAQPLRTLLTFICINEDKLQTSFLSGLPIFSKNFEKVYEIQLSEYFDKIFNPFNGTSIEPCGTPLWMSAQPLRTLLTFICWFRFDK
jgi:hypothetical protein